MITTKMTVNSGLLSVAATLALFRPLQNASKKVKEDNPATKVLPMYHVVLLLVCITNYTGLLDAVGSLSITTSNTSVLITWTAPFSFEFSTLGPDITYCVDVVVNTQSSTDLQEAMLIHSECDVKETDFTFVPLFTPSTCDEWEFIVTPVNLAGNGTRSTLARGLTFASEVTANGNRSLYTK